MLISFKENHLGTRRATNKMKRRKKTQQKCHMELGGQLLKTKITLPAYIIVNNQILLKI